MQYQFVWANLQKNLATYSNEKTLTLSLRNDHEVLNRIKSRIDIPITGNIAQESRYINAAKHRGPIKFKIPSRRARPRAAPGRVASNQMEIQLNPVTPPRPPTRNFTFETELFTATALWYIDFCSLYLYIYTHTHRLLQLIGPIRAN